MTSDSSFCFISSAHVAPPDRGEKKRTLLPRSLQHLTKRKEKRGRDFYGMSESKMRGEVEGCGWGGGEGEEGWERSSTQKVGEGHYGNWCALGERGRTHMQNI